MASNFDLSNLEEYCKEATPDVIKKLYFGKSSREFFTVREMVKGKQKINYVTNAPTLTNDSCGWVGGGNTVAFPQREIDVIKFKSESEYCVKDLEDKWLSTLLKKGSTYEEFPFEQLILENLQQEHDKLVENLLWRGVYSGVTGTYMDLMNGVVQVLTDASGSTVKATVYTGTTTVTNVADKIDEICELLPTAIKDKKCVIFTSIANYMLYVKYLHKANLFHYTGEVNSSFSIQVPWMPNVTVIAVEGLSTNDDFIATVEGNFLMAVDSKAEMTSIEAWYERKEEQILSRLHFKLGVNLYFPEYVVVNGI